MKPSFLKIPDATPRTTWILFFVSLLLHLIPVLVLRHYQSPNLWENGAIAAEIWDGKGFSANFSREHEPTSWQAPGYPYLLVLAWKIFGYQSPTSFLLLSLLHVLTVASMVFPMGWLAQRWFGPRVALVTQILTILMPLYLWYATRIHHTAIVMALHPWLLCGWLRLSDNSPKLSQVVLTGLGTGLAGLFQPVLLLVFFPIAAAKLTVAAARKQWRTASMLAAAGILVVLAITPWTIRNYQVHGKVMLIKDSFGKEFWMGNNPHATGTGYAIGGAEEITNVYPPKTFEHRGAVSEIELMTLLQKEAMQYVRENPQAFFKITASKIWWFWTMPPKDRIRTTKGGEAVVFRGIHAGYWLAFVVLLFIAAVWHRPWTAEYLLVLLVYSGIFSLIYGLTHVGQARFRGEIEFVFLPAVCAGMLILVASLANRLSRKQSA